MSETGYIVQVLRLGISGSAGLRNASPYIVKSRVPLAFDFDAPSVTMCENPRRGEPTVFATEKEAKEKVEDLLARVKALIRIGERTGKWASIGCATALIPHDYGSGPVGGWEVVPAAGWWAEREEEQRFHDGEAREQLAAADSEAQAAQAKADALRGEIKPTATPSTAGTGKWVATDTARVQVYERQNGSQSFRGRKDGGVSPSYDTKEEAVSWLEGEAPPEKVPEERAAALEALGDVMMRS